MADDSIDNHHEAEVIVIGAGLSGLAAVIALRRAGFDDVVVLEKSVRLGGTWRDNTYPGCGCDVPAVLYEYSFAPHAWSRGFADRSEILDYLDSTAATHGAHKAIRYDTEVLGARWEPQAHRWNLRTTSGTYTARAVIVATGPWHRPRRPDIPGLDTFPGTAFHSARWNHEVDLTGRRVAVVGTGASTVQFLPEIQPRAAHVDVFQSTPQWVLPKPDYPSSGAPPVLRTPPGSAPRTTRPAPLDPGSHRIPPAPPPPAVAPGGRGPSLSACLGTGSRSTPGPYS